MAITTKERTQLREELVGQGYAWKYIDEWQPKVTLYRHTEMKNPSGEVVSKAGTKLGNLPGNPDYVNRKARLGLFPWSPSDTCACRWCAEKSANAANKVSAPRTAKLGPYFDSNS
jgi:hypothetical protein